MIVVRFKAGLGNQMFQYALGKRLSLDWGEPLKFDLSWFDNIQANETPRVLEIDKFNVVLEKASPTEIGQAQSGIFYPVKNFIARVQGRLDRNFFYRFNPRLLKKRKNIYVSGYFQAYQYFDSIRSTLLGEFELKNYSAEGLAMKNEIAGAANSVALHVRRGDYVTTCEHWNGLCDINYYQNGLAQIKKKYPNLTLFVFSDDIAWAKENLKFGEPTTFVSRPELCPAEEIKLMSLCHHQIIANSSFSWWGAWLNANANKIVVAPSRWLIVADINTKDLLPRDWIII